MLYPRFDEVSTYRDITTTFGGYNHRISCAEGQFLDMKNMTSQYYPVLSPRQNRGIVRSFTNPQGILDKEDVWWIDDKVLYKNGKAVTLSGVTLSNEAPKTMAKMGAYIIIMPDKVWVQTKVGGDEVECGYMENTAMVDLGTAVTFSMCEASGKAITWHDADYYKDPEHAPKDGDYQMTVNANGNASLKVYSATTGIWMNVNSTYLQISSIGIGEGFEKEDGIKITVSNRSKALENIFVNEEGDGKYSVSTYIVDKTGDSITIPGIYSEAATEITDITITLERKVPEMSYITECNNRLWGCSKDGHEIYCCKLGDVKNWNCFRGVSTDSWAATLGSDGVFTGAVTFLGYPMFFKENCLIKVAVSSTGGHQVKETMCRGVQKGSDRSIAIMNEVLYYKSATCVCIYNGSLPANISDDFGDSRYYDAVASSVGDRYYISMRGNDDVYNLFVYDAKTGIWCKEDDTEVLFFCRHSDDLYFIDAADKVLKSVRGTLLYDGAVTEGKCDWYAESGAIGYSSPDNKYVSRINIRITIEFGTNVDFYLQYDSDGEWKHVFNMSGKGTKTFSVPVIPRRCDHFKYRIVGKGGCKIHSITKTIEEGSDI